MKTAFFLFFIILLFSVTAKSQTTFNKLNVKDLNVNGNIQVVSTTEASTPCPEMTETQRDAIASPVLGNCVTNSDTLALNVYNGTIWKAAGGGGVNQWLTSTGYNVDDVVIESFKFYVCLIAHTSGTFATDLAGLDWQEVSTGLSGLVSLAQGGTEKALTASNGAIAYSDTDSLELLAPGTSGQILQTNGVAAPTFVNKSISGKAQNKTAVTSEEIQFPNNLLTETGTNKYLSESGNKNILDNPSFEHSTFSTSWTNSAGTFTQETSVLIDGKASAKLVLSAQTMALTQSSTLYAAQFADGVQGLAMVRIKSDIALSVCSIQAGTVSTTNCVTTSTDSKWGLYKIPFVMGATSQGISIASSGSVSGTVYLDDANVSMVDLKQDINNVGAWRSFTPTGSWTTNTTYTGKYRQVGESLEIIYDWATTGAPTATSLILNLPSGFTIDSTKYPVLTTETTLDATGGVEDSGAAFYDLKAFYVSATSIQPVAKGTTGTYLSTQNPVTQAVPFTWGASDSGDLYVKVPVTQFSGSSSVYSAQCGANCVDTFSAKISSAGVVSSENVDFINENCVVTATSTYTCTFISGLVTNGMNCAVLGTNYHAIKGTQTSSTFQYATYNSAHAAAVGSAEVICQKTGADFVATRTIQGTFNEVNVSPGISRPKTCHYAFGGAAATLASPTECTTGTCVEVYDSCGTGTPPAFAGTASYNDLTWAAGTWANSSYIKCDCRSFDVTSGTPRECHQFFTTSDNNISTTSSGGYIGNFITTDTDGVASTSYTTLECKGSAP
jgi:hypothetical protein